MAEIPKTGTLVPGSDPPTFPIIREIIRVADLAALNALDPANLYVGMLGIISTDPQKLYRLIDLTPTWAPLQAGSAKSKDPVRTAAAINQAAPPQLGGAYGGITVADGDRVLILSNQANPPTSGIWVVNTAGPWTRPVDFDTGDSASASSTYVQDGSGASSKKGITYVCSSVPPADIIGTDQLDWIPIAIGGRQTSPGVVIYDDNAAGGGISTTNAGIGVLSYGSSVWAIGAALGGLPYVLPSLDYSYLGFNPALGAYYTAIGEATIRQLGSRQYDYPAALATPAITTVVATGVNNGVTRGYKIVAIDPTPPGGSQFGGSTAASIEVTDSNGATIQGGPDYETISWVDVPGAASYDIYLTFSSIGETLGKVGSALQGIQQFLHQGQIGNGAAPPLLRSPRIDTYNGTYQIVTLSEDIGLVVVNGGGGFPVSGTSGLEAQEITIAFLQDSAGGWEVTPPANMELAAPFRLNSSPNALSLYSFRWDKTIDKWVEQSRSLWDQGSFHSKVSTVGAVSAPFPDSFTTGDDGAISALLMVSFRRTDAGVNEGHAGQIILRTLWTRLGGVLRKIGDAILGTNIEDPDLAGATVVTSSPSPGVVVVNVAGVPGSTIDWVVEGFAASGNAVPSTLLSITVTPVNDAIPFPGTKQFTATGHYSNGSTADLTATATWSIVNGTGQATIAPGGLATAVAVGDVTVQATLMAITGSTGATVTDSVIIDMEVDPPTNFAEDAFTGTGTLYLKTGTVPEVASATPVDAVSEFTGPTTGPGGFHTAIGARGVWVGPAHENTIGTDGALGAAYVTNFSLWSGGGGVVKTPNDATAPDGTLTATRVQDSNAAAASNVNIFTAIGGRHGITTMFAKDRAGDIPTQPGHLDGGASSRYIGNNLVPFSNWTEIPGGEGGNIGGGYALLGVAGQADWPTFSPLPVAPVGSLNAWGAQTPKIVPAIVGEANADTRFPLTTGSITRHSNARASGPAVAVIVSPAGDIDIEARWTIDAYFGYLIWFNNSGIERYVWRGNSTDGETSLRIQRVGGVLKTILKVKGVDVLEKAADTTLDRTATGGCMGQEVIMRAWWIPSLGGAGSAGIRTKINGNIMADASGTATGTALVPFTSFDIGHNAQTKYLCAHFHRVQSKIGFSRAEEAADFVFLGDSTTGQFSSGVYPRAADFVLDFDEARIKACRTLSTQGETIAQQKARWQALSTRAQAKVVFVCVGMNDVTNPIKSTASISAEIQDLIDTIKADAPTCAVVLCEMTPAKGYFDTLTPPENTNSYNRWLGVNANIASGTFFTSVDLVESRTNTDLNDGADALAAKWSTELADPLHPGEFGRVHIGLNIFRDDLITLGYL